MRHLEISKKSGLIGAALLLTAVAVTSFPATASAESSGSVSIRQPGGDRPLQLDVHGGFSHWGIGAAAGARFGIPIVQNGFVRSINNAVYINFGADFYWVKEGNSYFPAVGIPVTLHWEFYFTERWSAFAELGVNVYLHPNLFRGNGWDWSPGHWVLGAVGGRFFINDSITLTLRLGNPYSSFGVSFMF